MRCVTLVLCLFSTVVCNIMLFLTQPYSPSPSGFLSTYKGRQLGTIGDFGCFSFPYTKNVMCGEGGAISVNRNEDRAKRALVMWEKGTNRWVED